MAAFFSRIRRLFEKASPFYAIDKHYAQLRAQILSVTAEQLGDLADRSVWAILMETGYPDAVVTLFAGVDGATSLYFSSGGGVIGAGEHDHVRSAALALVRECELFVPKMSEAASFPLPRPTFTRFYVRTANGVVTAEAKEDDLGNNRDHFSPLFYAGHQLIEQVRIMNEKRRVEAHDEPNR